MQRFKVHQRIYRVKNRSNSKFGFMFQWQILCRVPTWDVAQHSILQGGQGETECYVFRALVSNAKLNQQSSSGSLEGEATLQHGRLCGGSFGWQIHNHQTLKLLKKLLWHWVASSLGLLPSHLEPVERLIHLHHLLMKSTRAQYACVQGRAQTEQDNMG